MELLQRGYECGSILTVDPEEAVTLGKPALRRYIYNAASCPRCLSRIQSWVNFFFKFFGFSLGCDIPPGVSESVNKSRSQKTKMKIVF